MQIDKFQFTATAAAVAAAATAAVITENQKKISFLKDLCVKCFFYLSYPNSVSVLWYVIKQLSLSLCGAILLCKYNVLTYSVPERNQNQLHIQLMIMFVILTFLESLEIFSIDFL